MSCNSVPDIAAIQGAYEREASAGSTLHDKGLQVLQAQCHDDGTDKFICDLTLISKADPERPYFDIVSVAGHARARNSRAACASDDTRAKRTCDSLPSRVGRHRSVLSIPDCGA
jgi:hypothetical protein